MHFLSFMCSQKVSPRLLGHSLGIMWGKNKQKEIKDMVPVLKKLLVSSEGKTHTHLTIEKELQNSRSTSWK